MIENPSDGRDATKENKSYLKKQSYMKQVK